MKAKQMIYPVIVALFASAVAALFFFSAKFLTASLNRAFVVDEKAASASLPHIDLPNYYMIAKKLGINTSNETVSFPASAGVPAEAQTSSAESGTKK